MSVDGQTSPLTCKHGGLCLDQTPRTVQRLRPGVIDAVLASIFCPDKVSFLSWGVKRVRVNGGALILPAIMRRRNRASLFESYLHESLTNHPTEKIVSASTFYRIATAVTAGDSQERTAIDYVVGFLVNDQFDVLRTIVQRNITDVSLEKLLVEMEYNAAYLKHGFDARVKSTEIICALHDIKFGLSSAATPCTTSICPDCTSVLRFYARLKTYLVASSPHPSALTVTDDCEEKTKLFLGHRLRVLNQQQTPARIVLDMKERCIRQRFSEEALVVVEFKMKLEPLYHLEKTVDHYGKRGMSWHGALAQYFAWTEEEQSAVDQGTTTITYL